MKITLVSSKQEIEDRFIDVDISDETENSAWIKTAKSTINIEGDGTIVFYKDHHCRKGEGILINPQMQGTIKVTGAREMKLRYTIANWLILLSGYIANFDVEIVDNKSKTA